MLGKGLLLTVLAFGLTFALRHGGALQTLEWSTYDVLFSLTSEVPPIPRTDIAVAGLNKRDEAAYGSTLSDDILTTLLTRLNELSPLAVGLDLIRDRPEPRLEDGSPSPALQAIMRDMPSLVGIVKETEPSFAPPPAIADLDHRIGAADIVRDSDGVVRRGLLFISAEGKTRPTLALQLAARRMQQDDLERHWDGDRLTLGAVTYQPLIPSRTGYYQDGAADGGYQFLLRYPACSTGFDLYSVQDVIDGEKTPDLAGKIVLVGNRLELSKDVFTAPAACGDLTGMRIFGVDLQAQITSQLIDGAGGVLHPLSTTGQLLGNVELGRWLDGFWTCLWCGLGVVLALMTSRALQLSLAAVIALLGLLGVGYAAFAMLGWWLPLVPPAIGSVLALALTAGLTNAAARGERDRLHELLAGVVSKRVADALWQQSASHGKDERAPPELMMATVMFTDIKGFTTISEKLPEPILAAWLNEYLEAMVDIVDAHDGVIEKFAGDGLTIEFGPPDHRTTAEEIAADATSALDTALAMEAALNLLNRRWRERGWPEIGIRVGIHSGQLMVGAVGGASRFQYSIIGDTANTAARLEAYGKDDPALKVDIGDYRILISETTYHYLEKETEVHFVGHLRLRGKSSDVTVYRIVTPGMLRRNDVEDVSC